MSEEGYITYSNKLKLLYLKDVLEKYTDAEHGLTHAELMAKLRACGVDVKERTLRDDLLALQDYMYGTEMELTDNIKEGKEKAHPTRYMLKKRLFTATEVKLLMESVKGMHSLSEQQTTLLITKLSQLCSDQQAAQIYRELAETGGFKACWHKKHRDVLMGNIELIDRAIREKRKISFRYFWYKVTKEPTYPSNSKMKHELSPLKRIYKNGFYYVVGIDEKGNVKHFRLERMTDVVVSLPDSKRTEEYKISMPWDAYVNAHVGMEVKVPFKRKRVHPVYNANAFYYKYYKVSAQFTRDLVGAVLDQFGQHVWIQREDKGHFTASFIVQYNPQFVEWILGMGNRVQIIKPAFMHRDISRYAQAMYKWHDVTEVADEHRNLYAVSLFSESTDK